MLVRMLEENNSDDFCRYIVPAAINTRNVYAYPFDGYWVDIGTTEFHKMVMMSANTFESEEVKAENRHFGTSRY
jgi:ADP-glucose pyrophosphorylase